MSASTDGQRAAVETAILKRLQQAGHVTADTDGGLYHQLHDVLPKGCSRRRFDSVLSSLIADEKVIRHRNRTENISGEPSAITLFMARSAANR